MTSPKFRHFIRVLYLSFSGNKGKVDRALNLGTDVVRVHSRVNRDKEINELKSPPFGFIVNSEIIQ